MVKRLVLLGWLAACGKFEDPAIVIDLRPIAMAADVPEQVVNVDLNHPPAPDQVLAQLVDAHVSVLLSDQNFVRGIRWSAELCNLTDAERCDHANPYVALGSGEWPDPEFNAPPEITVPADGNLLGVLFDELQNDTLHGLGGIYYGVSLRFGGDGADPALDEFAAKTLVVQPAIPLGRTPNQNPTIDHIDTNVGDATANPVPLPIGRCDTVTTPLVVAPSTKLHLQPVEFDTTRETYSVPTIDGMTRTFTEAVTYQWIDTGGKLADTTTGGGHDAFGNLMPVHTTWTSPAVKDLDPSGDVQLWIIQRDERLGVSWYEACVHVQP
jgi:hypothetical protein